MTTLNIAWLSTNASNHCLGQHGYYCDWYNALAMFPGVRVTVGPSTQGADFVLVPYHCTVNSRALPACMHLARNARRMVVMVNKVFEGMTEKMRILNGVKDRILMLVMASPMVHQSAVQLHVRPLFFPYGVNPSFAKHANATIAYKYDIGFSGGWQRLSTRYPLRRDCWSHNVKSALQKNGVRLFTHNYVPMEQYTRTIAESKLWFSTTERGDHVTTRVLEVLASGRAMLVVNRNHAALGPLGIREGKHAAMFSSAAEYMDVVMYYTRHEATRQKIVRQAHELALKNHTWFSRASTFVAAVSNAMREQHA